MKALKNYFLLVALALIAAFATSCGGKDEEELDPFIQLDNPQTFYNTYKSRLSNGGKAILVDLRAPADYAKDGLSEAVNVTVMKIDDNGNAILSNDGKPVVNSKDVDPSKGGTWTQKLLQAAGDKNTAVFLYGNTNFTYTRLIAGQASKAGFGKKNTYITLSSMEKLQEAAMGNK